MELLRPDHIQMKFHPLMEVDRKHVDDLSLLKRYHIKILTYNIFIRPPPIKNNENDYKDERLDEFITTLNNFDVICLQEMFGSLSTRRHKLVKSAFKSGLFYHVEVPSPSFFSKNIIDAGLVILSRFPIIESEFRPFKYTVLSCAYVEKGVLYAKIQLKDSFLIVFNLHLQASYNDKDGELHDVCLETRQSHIDEASKFIEDILHTRDVKDDDKILLMGDFNVDSHNFVNKKNLNSESTVDTLIRKPVFEEYKYLFQRLNEKFVAEDLWLKKHEKHPYTYGVTGEISGEKHDFVLTDKEDIGNFQTLDYIFEIRKKIENIEFEEKNKKSFIIDYNTVKQEKFLIENKPFQQLSDHFGVSVELNYN